MSGLCRTLLGCCDCLVLVWELYDSIATPTSPSRCVRVTVVFVSGGCPEKHKRMRAISLGVCIGFRNNAFKLIVPDSVPLPCKGLADLHPLSTSESAGCLVSAHGTVNQNGHTPASSRTMVGIDVATVRLTHILHPHICCYTPVNTNNVYYLS